MDGSRSIDLLLEHRAFLRRLSRSLVNDAASADDLEQETWLAALKRPPRSPHSSVAWLASTVRRIAGKARRGDDRRERREQQAAPSEPDRSNADAIQRLGVQHEVVAAVLRLTEPFRTAIVLRYLDELSPQQIADRVGVPVNTVRGRLRRGLEQLRAALDAASGGERRTWCVALAPLVAAPTATAGILSGVVAMTAKSLVTSTAIAAGALVTAAWFLLPDDGGKRDAPVVSAPAIDDTKGRDAGTATRDGDAGSPSLTTDATRAETTPGAAAPTADLPDPGRFTFRVVDARTGNDVPDAGLRAISAQRYAEWSGTGDGSLLVSAGQYDVTAYARGYETLSLDDVVIDERASKDLGTIVLEPGSGSIRGTARVLGIGGDAPLTIELYGRGRRPCGRCDHGVVRVRVYVDPLAAAANAVGERSADDSQVVSEPEAPQEAFGDMACPDCGFRDELSVLHMQNDHAFAFPGLASGTYLLRIYSEQVSPIPIARTIELERGQTAWVDLSLERCVDVEFALVAPDGQPFDARWTSGDAERAGPIRFELEAGGEAIAQARWADAQRQWLTNGSSAFQFVGSDPIVVSTHVELDLAALISRASHGDEEPSAGSENPQHSADTAPQRDDRERDPTDEATPPHIDSLPGVPTCDVEHLGSGRYLMHGVPPRFLSAWIVCGPFGGGPTVFDARAGSPGVVTIPLRRLVCEPGENAAPTQLSMGLARTGQDGVFVFTSGVSREATWHPRTTTCTECHERR